VRIETYPQVTEDNLSDSPRNSRLASTESHLPFLEDSRASYCLALPPALILTARLSGKFKAYLMLLSPGKLIPIEWSVLKRSRRPNTYLVAPPGFTPIQADMAAPDFALDLSTLKYLWDRMLSKQVRIETRAKRKDGLQIDYIQRTALLRFPDWITVRFIAKDHEVSTLAIYSRSVYGYGDMGANKARVQLWLTALKKEFATSQPAHRTISRKLPT